MNKKTMALLLVIGLMSVASLVNSVRVMRPNECPWRSSQWCATSFLRIASNPERYDGRHLYTFGYVAVSAGNVYLYQSEAAYMRGEPFDRILIDLSTLGKIAELEHHLYTYNDISGVMHEGFVGKEGPAAGRFEHAVVSLPIGKPESREGWDVVGIPVERIGPDGNPR